MCLSEISDGLCVVGGGHYSQGRVGTFQPFLTVLSPSRITPESRIVTAESNCCSCAVLCQLHFVDGDLWRVTFPPLSQPPPH